MRVIQNLSSARLERAQQNPYPHPQIIPYRGCYSDMGCLLQKNHPTATLFPSPFSSFPTASSARMPVAISLAASISTPSVASRSRRTPPVAASGRWPTPPRAASNRRRRGQPPADAAAGHLQRTPPLAVSSSWPTPPLAASSRRRRGAPPADGAAGRLQPRGASSRRRRGPPPADAAARRLQQPSGAAARRLESVRHWNMMRVFL